MSHTKFAIKQLRSCPRFLISGLSFIGLNVGGLDHLNRWEIDITTSPSNGQTPLHNALGSGHYKIACMLLEKGGVKLLDMKDSHVSIAPFGTFKLLTVSTNLARNCDYVATEIHSFYVVALAHCVGNVGVSS